MTVKVNSDDDFVENVHGELSSNVVSASYDILNKSELSIGTLAHEVRKALDVDSDSDAEIAKWCDAVTSVQVAEPKGDNDGTLGRMFWRATDYTASEYTKLPTSSKYEAIPTAELRDTEYANQHDDLVKAGIISDDQTVLVPQTDDGDVIPVIAVSNDKNEANPTFETAKNALDKFVSDRFGEVEIDEEAETDSGASNDKNPDSDSDSGLSAKLPEGVADFTEASGIGDNNGENLIRWMVKEDVTVDSDDLEALAEEFEIETYDMSDFNETKVEMLRSKDWSDEEIHVFLSA